MAWAIEYVRFVAMGCATPSKANNSNLNITIAVHSYYMYYAIYATGDIYAGNFANDRYNGHGKYTWVRDA